MSLNRSLRAYGLAAVAVGLAFLYGRAAADSTKSTSVQSSVIPTVHQMSDPNYKYIVDLQSRVADLEKKLAAFQHEYATHTHRYKTPPCGYYNMLTLRDYLAKGSTSEGVCVINPAMMNPGSPGIPTTPPVK